MVINPGTMLALAAEFNIPIVEKPPDP